MRARPTHATVVAYIALFLALGGGAMAASQLGKNSVGTKQLKKNAVTAVKIKDGAVTGAKIADDGVTAAKLADGSVSGAKVADGGVTNAKLADASVTGAKVAPSSLTGKQVDASTLGVVPVAQRANSLPPPEPWHIVGAPGEPQFENGWKDFPAAGALEAVAFYKDNEGVVHLKGRAGEGTGSPVFALPPGFRPAVGKTIFPIVSCECPGNVAVANIGGTLPAEPSNSGTIYVPATPTVGFDGITFRAES